MARVELPILVLANDSRGEDSLVAPRRLASIIPGAQFRVIHDTGHWPHWEAPEEFNETIRRFLMGERVA